MQLSYTTTITSKGQFTVPVEIRRKLKARAGTQFDVQFTGAGFLARPKGKSKIMEFAGILVPLDDGKSLSQIRNEAQKIAAATIAQE